MKSRGLLNIQTPKAQRFREEAWAKIEKIARFQANQYWENRESFLRGTNRTLLEMKKKNATILPTDEQRIYYRYKFNPNVLADKPTAALNTVIPLWGDKELENLDFNEVLEMRAEDSWKEAMEELRELSFNTDEDPLTDDFEEWIKDEMRKIFLNSSATPEPKWKKRLKFGFKFSRNLSYSALDFVLFGAGTVLSSLDMIAQNYLETRSGSALPLFLYSIREHENPPASS